MTFQEQQNIIELGNRIEILEAEKCIIQYELAKAQRTLGIITDNLTNVQEECTRLLLENRELKARLKS